MDNTTCLESMNSINRLWNYVSSISTIVDRGFEHYNYLDNQTDFHEKFYVYRFSHILKGINDLLAINLETCALFVTYSHDYTSNAKALLGLQIPLIDALLMISDLVLRTESFISDIYLDFSKFEDKYNSKSIELFSKQKELLEKIINELALLEECFEEHEK